MLKLAAASGEIRLKYLEETGFSCWSGVQYDWIKQGKSKRFEQTRHRNASAYWESFSQK